MNSSLKRANAINDDDGELDEITEEEDDDLAR